MGAERTARGSDLTPEQKARIEAIRAANRTPEARARQAAIREQYADKPGLDELIRRGEVDPERITTMGAMGALLKATAAVRRAREARGLSLTEVARRSGLPLPTLSRLESGKNPRPTFETLARYAAGVGLEVDVVVRERVVTDRRPDTQADEILAIRAGDLDQLLSMIHGRIEALRASSQGFSSEGSSDLTAP
jgi:transcriptional regulator with XRE-family HTH domain